MVQDTTPSRLRQPTQYASPPSKHRPGRISSNSKFRSISDMSDDTSDSDSCIFPLILTTPKATKKRSFRAISPKSKDEEELRAKLLHAQEEIQIHVEQNHALETRLHACEERNMLLTSELAATHALVECKERELQALCDENEKLRRGYTAQLENMNNQLVTHEYEWQKQQKRLQQLHQVNLGLETRLDDCHAALHAWQEQAKQAELRTRSMWQERLEMEYEMVRVTAKSNQTDERQQRMDELKALQGLHSVSLSVFKDEGDDDALESPSEGRQRSVNIQHDDIQSKDDDCWMDMWLTRQIKSHESLLEWLDTLEHHMDEDQQNYLTKIAATTTEWRPVHGLVDNECILLEIEAFLGSCRGMSSIEDDSQRWIDQCQIHITC